MTMTPIISGPPPATPTPDTLADLVARLGQPALSHSGSDGSWRYGWWHGTTYTELIVNGSERATIVWDRPAPKTPEKCPYRGL